MTIHVPLTANQIAAAKEIRSRLRYWQEADAALRKLAVALPGFDAEAALLKVAAINTLYGTNLYAFQRMAKHIEKVMGGARRPNLSPALVERIAAVPARTGQQPRRHFSFASKFCHFFVDAERFPIFDSWAQRTVARHLGRQRARDTENPYVAFVSNLERLRREARLTVDASTLDSYLWIRGGYEAWRKKPDRVMNGELREFFEKDDGGLLLKRLVGEVR